MRIRDLADEAVSTAEAFVNAVYMQAHRGTELPYALTYYPAASMNPFQRLLYSRAAANGYAVVPGLQLQDLGRVNWRDRSVIHLHWLASVLKGVESRSAAEARIAGFRSNLASWRAAGHRVVWSLHNVLPHDCPYPEAEVALRRVLVEGADAVHVLSHASVDEARRHYDLPGDKVFHVPHPSYEGWYANVDEREASRLELDLPGGAFTFAFFGSLQPYKGVLDLIDAFRTLRAREHSRPLRLVIAGKPIDAGYADEIRSRISDDTDILFIPSAMEERQVQVVFNAADVVVAPYRRTLNSGVALLASTFRKPLVAPAGGGLLETFADDTTLLYGPDQESGLVDAMERAFTHVPSPEVFDRLLERHSPHHVSDAFFHSLTQRLFDQGACDEH